MTLGTEGDAVAVAQFARGHCSSFGCVLSYVVQYALNDALPVEQQSLSVRTGHISPPEIPPSFQTRPRHRPLCIVDTLPKVLHAFSRHVASRVFRSLLLGRVLKDVFGVARQATGLVLLAFVLAGRLVNLAGLGGGTLLGVALSLRLGGLATLFWCRHVEDWVTGMSLWLVVWDGLWDTHEYFGVVGVDDVSCFGE